MFAGLCFLTVIVYSFTLTNGALTSKKQAYTPIRYPGPINDVSSRYGSEDDDVPAECKDLGYCTIKPPNYPQERFNEMFKGTKVAPQPTLVIEEIFDRIGDPDLVDDCTTQIKYEPLFLVKSKEGSWRTVVQSPEQNYLQKVRLEVCTNNRGPCFLFLDSMMDVVTMCNQKYSVWEFLVTDGKNGTETIKTELPTCCSCSYKSDFGR